MSLHVPSARSRALQHSVSGAGSAGASERHPAIARFGDYRLGSHFQPIYSLPHGRLVGHEALLRATQADGAPVSPISVFSSCADEQALSDCDLLSRLVHLETYARQSRTDGPRPLPEWLFLNVHPLAFQRLAQAGGVAQLRDMLNHYVMPQGSLVLEVLEAETADPARLTSSIAIAREAGMLIAIDDFGAGHSNFDRVWRMRPDIVKVDRSLVARAACDASAVRILRQMVSLIHECGAMVLIEGVETHDEALVAIDCDAELVQGYLFGRPGPALMPALHAPEALLRLPGELTELRAARRSHLGERGLPFRHALSNLVARLAGRDVSEGSQDFADSTEGRCFVDASCALLALPGAEACYLLDAEGRQLGRQHQGSAAGGRDHPMVDADGVCWIQRPYILKALERPGHAQLSRPWRKLGASHLSATVAVAYPVSIDGLPGLRVACGDFRWEE